MSDTRRRNLLLGLLVVVLLFLVWRQFLSGKDEPAPATARRPASVDALEGGAAGTTVRRSSRRSNRRAAARPISIDDLAELRVADLEPRTGTYRAGRNPFVFFVPPPPPPPPPPPGPTAEEIAARLQAARERQEAEAARLRDLAENPPPPKPPPITFTYLGSFGPRTGKIAVFSEGDTIFNVREGDAVQEKFRLVFIGYESVDIEYIDFPDLPSQQLRVGSQGT